MKDMKIFGKDFIEAGKIKLPVQFQEEIRPDLIKKVFEVLKSHSRQSYGSDPRAGKKHSARLTKRRRKYRGSYGKGISRVPRKIMTRRGMQFNWVAAFAPGTVGGRKAFPPQSTRVWDLKINDKERKKAIRSALSASVDKNLVILRGHKIPDKYPFAVVDDFENFDKTKDVLDFLKNLGFKEELERSSRKKIRAGKGTLRGRVYKKPKGILIVTGTKNSNILKSAKNIPGVDVVFVKDINALLLAPGGVPGRIALFTKSAIDFFEKEALFV
jgi:large subunit ribosomal protein L4e